jgi:hypothetical protein
VPRLGTLSDNATETESTCCWIRKHALTGTLTQYPLNVGMYEFAIAAGHFSLRKPHRTTSEFIGKFSGGGLNHFHYEEGLRGVWRDALTVAAIPARSFSRNAT